jgi:hypothetical protein
LRGASMQHCNFSGADLANAQMQPRRLEQPHAAHATPSRERLRAGHLRSPHTAGLQVSPHVPAGHVRIGAPSSASSPAPQHRVYKVWLSAAAHDT